MMVRKFQMSDYLVIAAQEHPERLVIGDAGEQDEPLRVCIPRIALWKDCLCRVIAYGSKEKMLLLSVFADSAASCGVEVIQSQGLSPFAPFPRVKVGRAFRYDDDIVLHIRPSKQIRRV